MVKNDPMFKNVLRTFRTINRLHPSLSSARAILSLQGADRSYTRARRASCFKKITDKVVDVLLGFVYSKCRDYDMINPLFLLQQA